MLHGSPADGAVPNPSVAILGTDAVLAVLPATPIQLMHACMAAGYAAAAPASWGDELVASGCLRRLAQRESGPAILCACPYAADRLLETVSDLTRFLVPLVAPPVAVARYLRAVYGHGRVRITFVGGCPAGNDPAIDTHLTPAEFLANLATLGISIALQPEVFESVLPPDRRRFRSLPGGAPTPETLWTDGDRRALVELEGDNYTAELAHRLLTREHALLDMAPRLGCSCSGATPVASPRLGRAAIAAVEPPRSRGDVLDPDIHVDVDRPLPTPGVHRPPAAAPDVVRYPEPLPAAVEAAPRVGDVAADIAVSEGAAAAREAAAWEALAPEPRRPHVTPPAPRARGGHVPVARTSEGRVLPRAYAARRHHPRGGAVAVAAPAADGETVVAIPLTVAADAPAGSAEAPADISPAVLPPAAGAARGAADVVRHDAAAYGAPAASAEQSAASTAAELPHDAAPAAAAEPEGGQAGRGWLVRTPVAAAPVARDPRPVVVGEKVVGLDLRWLTERPFVRQPDRPLGRPSERPYIRRPSASGPTVMLSTPGGRSRGGRSRRKKSDRRRSGAAGARQASRLRLPVRRIALVAVLAVATAGVAAALYYSAGAVRRGRSPLARGQPSTQDTPAAVTAAPTGVRATPDSAAGGARSPTARNSAPIPGRDTLGGTLSGAITPPAGQVPAPPVPVRRRRRRPAAALRDSAADTAGTALDSIRRELRLRQNRLDSISRAVQSLPPTKPPDR